MEIDDTPVSQWGILKIVTVVLCLAILTSPFLPQYWYQEETINPVTLEVIDTEDKNVNGFDDDSLGGASNGQLYIICSLFVLVFIFIGHEITIDIQGKKQRINELLSMSFAFIMFVHSASFAWWLTDLMDDQYKDAGVGVGVSLVVFCSLILMLTTYLLWRERERPGFEFVSDRRDDLSPAADGR